MFAQNPGTGFTIWITGMQGAGKSALAREIVNRLRRIDKAVELLEGPEWDVFIGKGPGETKDERNAIVRRAGFVARALTRAGGFVLVPSISPVRETREQLRREIGRFLEVFVDAPFHTLLDRDSSGLYKKAMSGEIANFIGVTDPYEPPANPEVKADSSKMSIDDEATLVMEALVREGALTPSDIGLSRTPAAPKKSKEKEETPAAILFTPEMLKLPRPQPKGAVDAKGGAKPAALAAKPAAAPSKAAKTEAKPAKEAAKAPAKPAKAEAKPSKEAAKPAKAEPKAARTRAEAKAPAKAAKPARARAAAPVKTARPAKSAAKTARAAKPAPAKKAPAKAAKKPAAKAKKGKR